METESLPLPLPPHVLYKLGLKWSEGGALRVYKNDTVLVHCRLCSFKEALCLAVINELPHLYLFLKRVYEHRGATCFNFLASAENLHSELRKGACRLILSLASNGHLKMVTNSDMEELESMVSDSKGVVTRNRRLRTLIDGYVQRTISTFWYEEGLKKEMVAFLSIHMSDCPRLLKSMGVEEEEDEE